jgi:hypothetical protein
LPGGLAAGGTPGFGPALYVTRNVASREADTGPPADTSRILSYAGVLSDIGAPDLYGPSALEFDRWGNFGYRLFAAVADSFAPGNGTPILGRGALVALDSTGADASFASGLDSPVALAFAPLAPWTGELYVAERVSGAIDRVSPAGAVQSFASGLGLLMDLAFADGSFGNLLHVVESDSLGPDSVAHADAGRIVRFSSDGTRSGFVDGLHQPTSIVRAAPGSPFGDYLYVSLYNRPNAQGLPVPLTGRVVSIDPLGNVAPFADSLEQPMDMAFGPEGDLFVAVSGGLVRITPRPPSGVLSGASSALSLHLGPNPFTARTAIRLTLPGARSLEVWIFDLAGRRLTTLARGRFQPGSHEITWDGRDQSGQPVAPGLYLIRLRTEQGEEITRSVLRLR